ncbi:hypothetical protein Q9233_011181 [Columba guinea]|nr:hypothetical protein Q9233_011181 [Columba guinea]
MPRFRMSDELQREMEAYILSSMKVAVDEMGKETSIIQVCFQFSCVKGLIVKGIEELSLSRLQLFPVGSTIELALAKPVTWKKGKEMRFIFAHDFCCFGSLLAKAMKTAIIQGVLWSCGFLNSGRVVSQKQNNTHDHRCEKARGNCGEDCSLQALKDSGGGGLPEEDLVDLLLHYSYSHNCIAPQLRPICTSV